VARSRRRVAAALALLVGWALLLSVSAAGAQSPAPSTDQVRILEVSGLIDPVVADFLLTELDRAEADGILAVVLRINSLGSVLDRADFVDLADRLVSSPVQIASWVGPSGARATGGAAEIVAISEVIGVAEGSRIGDVGEQRLPVNRFGTLFEPASARLATTTIDAAEAVELGIAVGPLEDVSTLGSFLVSIPGYQTEQTPEGLVPVTETRFLELPLSSQLFHTVASPEVAYLLFVGGLGLLLFELFTAGIGVAGLVGAGSLVLGCYGLAVLPLRPLGLAMLVLAFLAFAVDVQTGVPRLYTPLGVVLFAGGTWLLYDGVTMSWVTGLAGIIGAVLYAYAGMPSMVRTRFSTPTIGRRWMIGELGDAVTAVDPEGTVRIRDAVWRAATNRATPILAGDRVRVTGLDRLVLEVEPEAGGARDYRDRH
jgi:membrane-bound serine protease (ClpP class)